MNEEIEWTEAEEQAFEDRMDAMIALLPAWFTRRMMEDVWQFGLLLSNGETICITNISKVVMAADRSLWIDAEMEDKRCAPYHAPYALLAPTSRKAVSINVAHIVAAFELADT